MKTETSFLPADRYLFDCNECSIANGFAQVDTGQDASYFGTWANADKLRIVCYCEGDITRQQAETPEEFVAALNEIRDWNEKNGHGFLGIDTGFDRCLAPSFEQVGAGHLLHPYKPESYVKGESR